MRLKTYTAPTLADAMAMVRAEMGEEAIIVATQKGVGGKGVRITAAREPTPDDGPPAAEPSDELADVAGALRQALVFHGTPPRLTDRLVVAGAALATGDAVLALAGALDTMFVFAPLAEKAGGRPVLLVGPPGAGKTVTVAKLAGGIEQLAAFTRILRLDLLTAEGPAELAAAVAACPREALVYVDTAGTNPFSDAEMDVLHRLVEASGAEPVLVLPAGGDALEAADIAVSFAYAGAGRLVVTRLDMARRLGSVLAAADAARLGFADVSITPHVADGLSPINPVSLARLLMPDAPRPHRQPEIAEAAP
jgi:flagellar biosynthesis protein FlhF